MSTLSNRVRDPYLVYTIRILSSFVRYFLGLLVRFGGGSGGEGLPS